MGRPHLCSGPVGTFEKGSWGGHLGEGGIFLGEVQRQVGEAGCCWFPWGRVASRAGTGRNSHLRADKARSLVTDMLQGSSNVNLLHAWGQEARGCSAGVQRRIGPGSLGGPGVGGLNWAEPGAGLRALWGSSSPFAMRFSTMSMRM